MEVMAIVHGRSEYQICCSIRSNLRLKHHIHARRAGKNSIQVTSVMAELNREEFRSLSNFTRRFPDVSKSKGKLKDFVLFIIMDVDDCTPKQRDDFISKELFRGHWLYDYIVPIYSDPNLEATMKAAAIPIKNKKDYFTVYPTSHGDLNITIIKEHWEKLRDCRCSNLDLYFKHCIAIAERHLLLK